MSVMEVVSARHPDTLQTTTLHHLLYFERSVHALFEIIDAHNSRHHELQSNLVPTSRRRCITHLSTVRIRLRFAEPLLFPLTPFTYSNPDLAVGTIEYKPSTLAARRHGVLLSSPRHQMAIM